MRDTGERERLAQLCWHLNITPEALDEFVAAKGTKTLADAAHMWGLHKDHPLCISDRTKRTYRDAADRLIALTPTDTKEVNE